MASIIESVDVDVPLQAAYNQWTQFEEFPLFMDGVEKVQQLDSTDLHWIASIAGVRREWDARIIEQVPDERIAWENLDGVANAGLVTFAALAPDRTRVTLRMEVDPQGVVENVGDALGFVGRQTRDDLEHFREFMNQRRQPSGGWRGEVHGTDVHEG